MLLIWLKLVILIMFLCMMWLVSCVLVKNMFMKFLFDVSEGRRIFRVMS